MTGEQLQRAVQVADPVTFEVLSLDSQTIDLARFLVNVRETESILREHKKLVTREILARLDEAVSQGASDGWTMHLPGGLRLSAASPAATEEWDGGELYSALMDLVDRGELGIDALNRAVETTLTYKVNRRGLLTLIKAHPQVAEIAKALVRFVPKDRYVKVERT